jgi:hypothetical protein
MNHLEIRGRSSCYRFYRLDAKLKKDMSKYDGSISDFVDEGGLGDVSPEYFTGLSSWPELSVNDVHIVLKVSKKLDHRFKSMTETNFGELGQLLLVNELLTEGRQYEWISDSKINLRSLNFDLDIFRFSDGTKSVLLNPTYGGIQAELCGEMIVEDRWRLYDPLGHSVDLSGFD